MKRYALTALIIFSLLLSGCSVPGKETSPASPSLWTLCLYLCGSNLESRQGWGTKTIEEITGTKLPEGVTVVVQTGGSKKWKNSEVAADENERFLVEDGELVSVDSTPVSSMGEKETLADFLSFCESNYPAKHTAVIFWNHGGGPLKGACFDENHDFDSLTLSELNEAFAAGVVKRGGKKYDIAGFDACLMGSLETAQMLSDDAEIMVASEEIEPGAGWDYKALIEKMGENASAEKVAAAACDGFMAKCESRKKSATVTLAAIDLSKIQDVINALQDALSSLKETRGSEVSALRRLAAGSGEAEGFGGATESEGMSNLIDLRGMAASLAENVKLNGAGWDKVVAAIDAAVLHHVNGSATGGANGISIWYPRDFERSELVEYTKTAPLSDYAETLEKLFSVSLPKMSYSDWGSIDKDGMFSITIAPEAYDSFYNLYVVNQRMDGDYQDINVDLYDDWEKLTFRYDFSSAVRITLDGMTLDAQVVTYNSDQIVFSCPVTVNGEKGNLRVAWLWDSYDTGHYELLGVWNGVDHVTGLSDRLTDQLSAGDIVGAVSLTTGNEREMVTVGEEIKLEDAPLEPGRYECHIVALDLHGNEYPSDTFMYEVTADGKTKLID